MLMVGAPLILSQSNGGQVIVGRLPQLFLALIVVLL